MTSNHIIAILVADGFEEEQFSDALKTFQRAGCAVRITATAEGLVTGTVHERPGHNFLVDQTVGEAQVSGCDALFVPGGIFSVQRLAEDPQVRALMRGCIEAGKPVATIGDAPLLLCEAAPPSTNVSAEAGCRDALHAAGISFDEQPLVVDGRIVSACRPEQARAAAEATLRLLAV